MENKTECTGFLARATIKPETKARLDKTESIMVRRPSLKWNFPAGARTSMKVDLLRPARLFVFQFLFPFLESTHWVTYGISNLSRRREFFICPGRSEVRLASPPPFSVLGPCNKKIKKPEIQKERREIGPSFPREAAFSQASSLLLLVDCSILWRASLFPGLCSLVYAPTQQVIIEKRSFFADLKLVVKKKSNQSKSRKKKWK